jgi:hypothetical protein
MAIRIPSKNIYGSPQNPKVRDNVIEPIEVGAVEVVPDNEYETPVYNENIKSPNFNEEKKHNLKYEKYTYSEEDSADEYEDYIGIYAGITAKYTNTDISIPKLSNNKLISNLLLKKDNESKIGINLICEVRYYSVTADYDTATNTIDKKTSNLSKNKKCSPNKDYTFILLKNNKLILFNRYSTRHWPRCKLSGVWVQELLSASSSHTDLYHLKIRQQVNNRARKHSCVWRNMYCLHGEQMPSSTWGCSTHCHLYDARFRYYVY